MEFLNEIIGLLIVLFVLFFPLVRRILIERKKKKQPTLTPNVAQEERPPPLRRRALTAVPAKRRVKQDFTFLSEIEKRKRKSALAELKLESKVQPEFKETVVSDALLAERLRAQKARAHRLLQREPSFKNMVIYYELFGKPKGLE